MKPTPGRTVHVNGEEGSEPFVAIITKVTTFDGEDAPRTSVNLAVFRHNGTLLPDGMVGVYEGTKHGTWRWPPRELDLKFVDEKGQPIGA